METFSLIKPCTALTPFIKYYWILRIDISAPVTERTIPVGCVHLTFHRGKQLFSPTTRQLQPQAFICGQSNTYVDVASTGNIDMITVVFQPYAPKLFFRLPVRETYGMNVSIEDIGDIALTDLAKRVAETPDDTQCIELIEHFLLQRFYSSAEYNIKRIGATIQEINQCPQPAIHRLAQTACLSDKQFNRVFHEYVGTTPKEFIRIVRLQRALYTLQTQPDINFAQLAYECGYYDQSHLIKEFKVFSGYTPGEYLALCAPYSDYFSTL